MRQGTLHRFQVDPAWSLAFRQCSRPQSLLQMLHRVIHFGWLHSMGFKSSDSVNVHHLLLQELHT